MTPRGRMQATIDEHAAIVEGILIGDAHKARTAMEAHLSQMTVLVEKFAAERPEMFSA